MFVKASFFGDTCLKIGAAAKQAIVHARLVAASYVEQRRVALLVRGTRIAVRVERQQVPAARRLITATAAVAAIDVETWRR